MIACRFLEHEKEEIETKQTQNMELNKCHQVCIEFYKDLESLALIISNESSSQEHY